MRESSANSYSHSTKAGGWTLRRKTSPKRWAPDLGGGVYIREGRTAAGILCFVVVFPNGKECHQLTFAEAQEYAEAHAAKNAR